MGDSSTIILILTLLGLVSLSAFFSCAETALMVVNRYRLYYEAQINKKRYAQTLLHLLQRPDRLLGAILIGNTFSNVVVSALATLLAVRFFGEHGALMATVFVTFIILIIAEIMPKTLAALHPEDIARWIVYPIHCTILGLYPVVWLVNTLTNQLLRVFHIHVKSHVPTPLSYEELRSLVYQNQKITKHHQNMLLGVLDLQTLTVDDVMIAHHDIVGIDIQQPWTSIVQQISQLHHDDVPIYTNHTNQIIGVLAVHKLLPLLLQQQSINKERILNILQQPYFIPSGTPLSTQLIHFQHTPDKIAFVVNEYGEIQGMLTIHDIVDC